MRRGSARSCYALVFILVVSACGESEGEREDRAMRDAVPVRLQRDGTIKLTDADQKALGIVTAVATDEDLSES